MILHGAGSRKESHFDFARAAQSAGMAALAYDARGHGRSEGPFGPEAVTDALAMCELLREHAPRVALRGSSMGAFCAIHAAARQPGAATAVVAICPAPEDFLLRGLRTGVFDFPIKEAPVEIWLESTALTKAVASLSPHTGLMLMHAAGDEQIPYAISEELHVHAGEPKRLLVMPGGHHRSLQHDAEMQGESLRFIERQLRR